MTDLYNMCGSTDLRTIFGPVSHQERTLFEEVATSISGLNLISNRMGECLSLLPPVDMRFARLPSL